MRVVAVSEAMRLGGLPDEMRMWAEVALENANFKSLARRLGEVLAATVGLSEAIRSTAPEFERRCVRLRNSTAHPDDRDYSMASYVWHGEVLLWIARTLILQKLGVDQIEERARNKHAFKEALRLLAET